MILDHPESFHVRSKIRALLPVYYHLSILSQCLHSIQSLHYLHMFSLLLTSLHQLRLDFSLEIDSLSDRLCVFTFAFSEGLHFVGVSFCFQLGCLGARVGQDFGLDQVGFG